MYIQLWLMSKHLDLFGIKKEWFNYNITRF